MVGNRCASCPPYHLHFCTRPKVQPQEITSSCALPDGTIMDLSSRCPAPHLAQGIKRPGRIPMGSPNLHPSGTRESHPDPKLTSTAKDRGPGAVSPHSHRAVTLFIGGAGDKKSYYLAGPLPQHRLRTERLRPAHRGGRTDGRLSVALSGQSRGVAHVVHRPAGGYRGA